MAATRFSQNFKEVGSMLLVQVFKTGLHLLSKMTLNNGTFIFALLTYRHVVAAICVAPFAIYFERDIITRLSWQVWAWMFVNALVGITSTMGFYYFGLRVTSATYAVNFFNLVPIITFLISIAIRLETLGLRSRGGQVKTFGAVVCVVGAVVTGLYHGKSFYITDHPIIHSNALKKHNEINYAVGTPLLIGFCLSYSLWFILQVKLIAVFPLKYWTTLLTCVLASTQSTVIGLFVNSGKDAWKLYWDLELLTIVYSGALASAATFCLVSYIVAIRGPTYPTLFNPLMLILVAILESILLGAAIHVGTILGAILIIVGLYSFLWAKGKDAKKLPPDQMDHVDLDAGGTKFYLPKHITELATTVQPTRIGLTTLELDEAAKFTTAQATTTIQFTRTELTTSKLKEATKFATEQHDLAKNESDSNGIKEVEA